MLCSWNIFRTFVDRSIGWCTRSAHYNRLEGWMVGIIFTQIDLLEKKKLYNKAIWAAIFTLRSPSIQRSLIVQSKNIILRLITIHTCSFFAIVSWLQTKHNVRITPEALQINRLSCVWTLHSLTVHRSWALTKFRSARAHRSLTVHMGKYNVSGTVGKNSNLKAEIHWIFLLW